MEFRGQKLKTEQKRVRSDCTYVKPDFALHSPLKEVHGREWYDQI